MLRLLQLVITGIVMVNAEIAMIFTKHPESVIAQVGDEVVFECAVRVPGERLVWRWRVDDSWTDLTGGTHDKEGISTKLSVKIGKDTRNAFYQCLVWYGAVRLASVPARLAVARIDASNNTAEKRVIIAPLHNSVVLHCKEPASDPPAILTWWKELKGIKSKLESPHGVLVIHNATVEDSGTYGCVATNEISGQVVELPEKVYLKVQHEGAGGYRFLESEEYAGVVDNEGVLTMPVRDGSDLHLWCGLVGTPPPKVTWSKDLKNLQSRNNLLTVAPFTADDEGIYSCTANEVRRSWKVIALRQPYWQGAVANVNASEGGSAHVACGTPFGQPSPSVHWLLNAEPVKNGKGIRSTGSDLFIDHVEKHHAGIVQCFACNPLGCAYDAALLTVVPVQISDQDYSMEMVKSTHLVSQPPKRHNKKNSRKYKVEMIPPSRPIVTRMSDESVMVTWSHANVGMPIQFYKVQYKEATNASNQWHTATHEIPPHIHAYEIDGLIPDRYYKFRIAAVYSNQDNKLGRSSGKFYLQRGDTQTPQAPELKVAKAISPHTIQLNWTYSSSSPSAGFYVYYRAVSSAGDYEVASARGNGMALSHLASDTAYELKVRSYNDRGPSPFSVIKVAKTHRMANVASSTEGVTGGGSEGVSGGGVGGVGGGGTLVTAGGAAGAAALLLVLAATLVLCRRAKRPTPHKEKASSQDTGSNGYIPGKVPITIATNPMHGEAGDSGVEMSFLHNNNCGNSDNEDTLPRTRKNGPSRQYV